MGTLKNYKVTWGVYNDFHRVNEGTHYVEISSEIIQSESKEEIVMRDWGGWKHLLSEHFSEIMETEVDRIEIASIEEVA